MPAVLDSIDGEIASGRYGLVDRLLVIRHGKVAFDKSYKQDYVRAYHDSVNTPGPLNPQRPGGTVQLLPSVVASLLPRR